MSYFERANPYAVTNYINERLTYTPKLLNSKKETKGLYTIRINSYGEIIKVETLRSCGIPEWVTSTNMSNKTNAFIRLNKKIKRIKEITHNKHKTLIFNILYSRLYLIFSFLPQLPRIDNILPQYISCRSNRRDGS